MAIHLNPMAPSVWTVAGLRAHSRRLGARSWRGALDRLALERGKAIALLGNDAALIVIREGGRIVRHLLRPDEIIWTRH